MLTTDEGGCVSGLSNDSLANAIDNIADIVVGDVGTGGETETDFEEGCLYFVGVGGGVLIDGLLVHGLPYGTALNFLVKHKDTEGFDVFVGLAIGGGGFYGFDDTGSTSDGGLDDFLIGVLLPLDMDVGVYGGGTEPIVGIKYRFMGQGVKGNGLLVDVDAGDVGKELFVEGLDVFVVGDVVIKDGHLATADTGAYVGHAVVVAYGGVLILRIGVAGLSGVPHDCLGISLSRSLL